MKTKILVLTVAFFLCIATVSAAPISEIETRGAVIGIMISNGNYNSTFFETKPTDTLVVGFQFMDWKSDEKMSDFYGQVDLSPNLKGIIGVKTFASDSKCYVGAARSQFLAPEWYTSLIFGSGFYELQIGANYTLTDTSGLNFHYHYFEQGDHKDGFGIGIICRF